MYGEVVHEILCRSVATAVVVCLTLSVGGLGAVALFKSPGLAYSAAIFWFVIAAPTIWLTSYDWMRENAERF
jgi:hypothetical protein